MEKKKPDRAKARIERAAKLDFEAVPDLLSDMMSRAEFLANADVAYGVLVVGARLRLGLFLSAHSKAWCRRVPIGSSGGSRAFCHRGAEGLTDGFCWDKCQLLRGSDGNRLAGRGTKAARSPGTDRLLRHYRRQPSFRTTSVESCHSAQNLPNVTPLRKRINYGRLPTTANLGLTEPTITTSPAMVGGEVI